MSFLRLEYILCQLIHQLTSIEKKRASLTPDRFPLFFFSEGLTEHSKEERNIFEKCSLNNATGVNCTTPKSEFTALTFPVYAVSQIAVVDTRANHEGKDVNRISSQINFS